MHLAKEAIRKQDIAVVVEGNMDVIALHQAGIFNVVASSGTALTELQIQLLKRYSKNLAFSFDMDTAGQNASHRAFDHALQYGMQVKSLLLPKDSVAKDPDEFVHLFSTAAEAQAAWKSLEETAQPFVERYFAILFTDQVLEHMIKKREATHAFLRLLAKMPDKIEQAQWLQQLARKVNVSEKILFEALESEYKDQKQHQKITGVKPWRSSSVLTPPSEKTIKTRNRAAREDFTGAYWLVVASSTSCCKYFAHQPEMLKP